MKTLPLAALAVASVVLSGCASLTGGDQTAMVKALEHIEKCERHYTGGTGVGAAFTFRIDCPASVPPVTTPAGPGQ